MIKVNYDIQSGQILGFYSDEIEYQSIPEPFIEITETQRDEILNKDFIRILDEEIKDISQTPEYIEKKNIENLQAQNAKIKKQIEELELSQNRALREILILENTSFAKTKLLEIEQQIESLRNQLS